MATGYRRESMIGLRATQKAGRIARDVAHPPVDLEHVYCEGCKRELDWQHQTGMHYGIVCDACRRTTQLPLHLRPHVVIQQDLRLRVRSEYDTSFRGPFP